MLFCKILHYCGVAVYSLNKGCFYFTSGLKSFDDFEKHIFRKCVCLTLRADLNQLKNLLFIWLMDMLGSQITL